MNRRTSIAAALVTICLVTLSGCATIRRHEAAGTEQLLAAAGFEMRPADNPERQGDLAAMPPFKIVARNRDQGVTYTYADPDRCRCLYVGGPKEYTAYQHLLVEKQIVQQRLWLEQQQMDWAVWGPWWYHW
jgi:hypothetical protein